MDERKELIINLIQSIDDEVQLNKIYILIKSFVDELKKKAVS